MSIVDQVLARLIFEKIFEYREIELLLRFEMLEPFRKRLGCQVPHGHLDGYHVEAFDKELTPVLTEEMRGNLVGLEICEDERLQFSGNSRSVFDLENLLPINPHLRTEFSKQNIILRERIKNFRTPFGEDQSFFLFCQKTSAEIRKIITKRGRKVKALTC